MDPVWSADPHAFINWVVINLGYPPDGYTLDRIDNNGSYVPGNLRWANAADQSRNRRATRLNGVAVRVIRLLSARGVSRKRLARAHGISPQTVYNVTSGLQWQM